MQTRAQEEERFRNKRIKKHGAIEVRNDPDPSFQLDFVRFIRLINGLEKFVTAEVVSMVLAIVIYQIYATEVTFNSILVSVIPLMLSPVLVYLYFRSYYENYLKFASGKFYKIEGWQRVASALSNDFFEGKVYAGFSVEIKPDPVTLPEERRRLFEFCSAVTKDGQSLLKLVTLNHFTLEIEMLVGRQSAFLVNRLVYTLADVVKQNRPDLVQVVFRFHRETIKVESPPNDNDRSSELMEEMRYRQAMERYEEN